MAFVTDHWLRRLVEVLRDQLAAGSVPDARLLEAIGALREENELPDGLRVAVTELVAHATDARRVQRERWIAELDRRIAL
jgi:hypothetical protein